LMVYSVITERELPAEELLRALRVARLEHEGLSLIGTYQDSEGVWWGKFEKLMPDPRVH